MKKLYVILLISQIAFASSRGGFDNIEINQPRGRVIQEQPRQITKRSFTSEGNRQSIKNFKNTNELTKKANRRTFDITQREKNARKDAQRKANDAREEAQRKAQKEARDKNKADKKAGKKEIAAKMTPEQQLKIKNVTEGFKKLQNDAIVIDVFGQLNLHVEFQGVMDTINSKADQQVTQDDLNSAQNFLKKLASQKEGLQAIDSKTIENFLGKFTLILQENFSELSSEELTQFLTQFSDMTTQALEPQVKKPDSKKSVSDGSGSYHKPEKQDQHKKSAKGGMPTGNLDVLGFMIGFSFTAAIFVLIQQLANQN